MEKSGGRERAQSDPLGDHSFLQLLVRRPSNRFSAHAVLFAQRAFRQNEFPGFYQDLTAYCSTEGKAFTHRQGQKIGIGVAVMLLTLLSVPYWKWLGLM
jgi:hypothetical protein